MPLPMSPIHAGPSDFRPDNQAMRPRRGRKGSNAPSGSGKGMGRTQEAKARKPARKRGLGKIKTTGKPRFTHFIKF